MSSGGLLELSDNLITKNIIALQFFVPPDLRLAAQAHAQDRRERCMKPGDPALLPGCQRLIVDVGVTDEEILGKLHTQCSSRREWQDGKTLFLASVGVRL